MPRESTMTQPTPDFTAIGGWITTVCGLLAVIIKVVYDRATAKDREAEKMRLDRLDHVQEIEKSALDDARAARAESTAELKAQLIKHESRIETLEHQLQALMGQSADQLAQIARLEVELSASMREVDRLRKSRDHYRAIALNGSNAMQALDTISAAELAAEISEADDAQSKG